jgi:hypothetical protein
MGIPSAFAFYLEALEGFITTENVFNRPAHYVVDAGSSVRRRWTFIESKGWRSFAIGYGFFKNLLFFPKFEDFTRDFGKIQLFVFFVLPGHDMDSCVFGDDKSAKIFQYLQDSSIKSGFRQRL